MADNRTFHVTDQDGQMLTGLGARYDQAGAEHFAQNRSRRVSGVHQVVPADGGRVVAKFENGKKVK
jgi:hypothetical protein